jgi:hypothetical protein
MPIKMPIKDGFEICYQGCVLTDREENHSDDSDFYAIVYDMNNKTMRRVDYNSTRYAGGGSCQVDATEDIKLLSKKDAYDRLWKIKKYDRTTHKGMKLRVIKGRKVPLGTTGVVKDIYTQYIYQHEKYTMLICEDESGNEFKTYPHNIEVIPPSDEDCAEWAESMANAIYRHENWHQFFTHLSIVM